MKQHETQWSNTNRMEPLANDAQSVFWSCGFVMCSVVLWKSTTITTQNLRVCRFISLGQLSQI